MLSQNSYFRAFSCLRLIQIFLLFTVTTFVAHARSGSDIGSVTLVWDSNSEPNVNGYNVHLGLESGNYITVLDAGDSPELEVPDLELGVTYYCAVTAYNTIGLESSFSAEIAITYVGGQGDSIDGRLILLEAEDGDLTPPMVVQGTSEVSWVQVENFSQEGATEITFDSQINAGYYTWCRVKAPNAGSDSYFFSMDGGLDEVFHVYGSASPPSSAYDDDWVWKRINTLNGQARVFNLSPGTHSIKFRSREPGPLLDRIVLCSDPDFVPNDSLPRSGDVLAITSSPVDKTVIQGGGVIFDVVAAATGPIQYQWVKDGLALNEETGPSLQILPADFDDAGNYSVFIWSDTAIKTTGAAALTILEPPFKVTSMSIASERFVTFNMAGQLGQEVEVFASNDLDGWTLISTQINTDGTIVVQDSGLGDTKKRFYKLVTPGP